MKNIKIAVDLQEKLPAIRMDENQIHQSLLNLCTNARDAMPDGGTLSLKTRRLYLDERFCKTRTNLKPGDYCLIQISDTGTGIPEEIKRKIFDPFFTTKEIGRGTGLGLSVTFGIIQNHGGHIRVHSEQDKGTKMRVYLPLTESKEVEKAEGRAEAIQSGSGMILIIDDEEQILQLASIALKKAGYETLSTDSGREAVEIYKERSKEIDLVLLDMVMPDMDGSAVFRALKDINDDVNVLLASGYSINGQAGVLMDEGINHFIQKPYLINDLCKAVKKALSH